VSSITSNQPVKIEIRDFKTSHFLEPKNISDEQRVGAAQFGDDELPQSERSRNNLQFIGRSM
jgi:hypothetical protein